MATADYDGTQRLHIPVGCCAVHGLRQSCLIRMAVTFEAFEPCTYQPDPPDSIWTLQHGSNASCLANEIIMLDVEREVNIDPIDRESSLRRSSVELLHLAARAQSLQFIADKLPGVERAEGVRERQKISPLGVVGEMFGPQVVELRNDPVCADVAVSIFGNATFGQLAWYILEFDRWAAVREEVGCFIVVRSQSESE